LVCSGYIFTVSVCMEYSTVVYFSVTFAVYVSLQDHVFV